MGLTPLAVSNKDHIIYAKLVKTLFTLIGLGMGMWPRETLSQDFLELSRGRNSLPLEDLNLLDAISWMPLCGYRLTQKKVTIRQGRRKLETKSSLHHLSLWLDFSNISANTLQFWNNKSELDFSIYNNKKCKTNIHKHLTKYINRKKGTTLHLLNSPCLCHLVLPLSFISFPSNVFPCF